MNVLILGSGGREHAFAWKLKQSNKLNKLYVAPGNAGTTGIAENLNLSENDFEGIKQAVLTHNIGIVLVGPEAPLVNGIRDFFVKDEALKNVVVIGPDAKGAQLEGSKDFSKKFMLKYGVPTAAYGTFTKDSLSEAKEFLKTMPPPYVLKADGLAAGKGVVISSSYDEACKELDEMLLESKFGVASNKVVIEEFLQGIELSVFVFTDGVSYVLLPSAKDYKRIGEGDTGLNTGGMGAVSPVPFADEAFLKKVEERVVKPTISGLRKEGIDYVGFIFIGLMNKNGEPWVIEYNCRMGDPETEVVMPRLKNDFLEMLEAAGNKRLGEIKVEHDSRTAVTVMLVSGGYPGDYEKGKVMNGFENLNDSLQFHAGTSMRDGKVVSNGGRVMAITAMGENIQEAVKIALNNAEKVSFEKKYFRKDIGKDLM